MDKWELLEKLECVKINLNNSKSANPYFIIGMDQLDELIDQVEKSEDS